MYISNMLIVANGTIINKLDNKLKQSKVDINFPIFIDGIFFGIFHAIIPKLFSFAILSIKFFFD